MDFASALNDVLPADLPHRDNVILKSAQHLALIVEANQVLNLTRITTPREAAIKHVLDSVIPWRLFAGAKHVLDAGTGPGFPGIPLALVLPEIQFILAESIQKKARFAESALAVLDLPNVTVAAQRAEDILKRQKFEIVTARAFAPISKALDLLKGSRLILYKGPFVEREISEVRKPHASIKVVMRYDLPGQMGARTIVEITGLPLKHYSPLDTNSRSS
ncbi:MAG: 16S rRNA (guanine(527)-N(7))-methyltransferase RsmG [Bryobacteraceae bacterium]